MNLPHPLARSLVTSRTWPFVIDVGVAACLLAIFFAIVSTGKYWLSKPAPVAEISHSISALPLYAFYSMVRIGLAYLLSLIFAVAYGYIAAYNPRIEAWMVAVLDILQSIPVTVTRDPAIVGPENAPGSERTLVAAQGFVPRRPLRTCKSLILRGARQAQTGRNARDGPWRMIHRADRGDGPKNLERSSPGREPMRPRPASSELQSRSSRAIQAPSDARSDR